MFDDGFNNTYWTPAHGTSAYTNDEDNAGNDIYYVGTRIAGVNVTESINVERILGEQPTDTISVTEVAVIQATFNRALSTTSTATDSSFVVNFNTTFTESQNATESS